MFGRFNLIKVDESDGDENALSINVLKLSTSTWQVKSCYLNENDPIDPIIFISIIAFPFHLHKSDHVIMSR